MSEDLHTRSADGGELPPPPRLNGPAFVAFGIIFALLGFSLELYALVAVGVLLVAIGVWGVVATRRYEREYGIEDTLPGRSPGPSADEPDDEDDVPLV